MKKPIIRCERCHHEGRVEKLHCFVCAGCKRVVEYKNTDKKLFVEIDLGLCNPCHERCPHRPEGM